MLGLQRFRRAGERGPILGKLERPGSGLRARFGLGGGRGLRRRLSRLCHDLCWRGLVLGLQRVRPAGRRKHDRLQRPGPGLGARFGGGRHLCRLFVLVRGDHRWHRQVLGRQRVRPAGQRKHRRRVLVPGGRRGAWCGSVSGIGRRWPYLRRDHCQWPAVLGRQRVRPAGQRKHRRRLLVAGRGHRARCRGGDSSGRRLLGSLLCGEHWWRHQLLGTQRKRPAGQRDPDRLLDPG